MKIRLSKSADKNTGIILGNRITDWKAGAISGIVYKEENSSGDWTPYLPNEEWQWWPNGFDSLACVTFSALNILETLYFFKAGIKRNFSDRFTAFMSGTTPQGNWQWKVGDSIRKDGLVDESLWPMIENPAWDTYYIPPPIEVINEAKKFLNSWQVNYEFIDFTKESLIKHLKQSPIQVVFPNHAVMLFATTEKVYKFFDSYSPFIKERSEGFVSAMKLILTKKTMVELKRVKGQKDTYVIGKDGKKHLLINFHTYESGANNIGLWDADVLEVDSLPQEDGEVIVLVKNE